MRRREFIAGLGSAAAWPVVARAQQQMMPVIGYLGNYSPDSLLGARTLSAFLPAFRQGLKEVGCVESQTVMIEYRYAQGQNDRFPAMAAESVQRQVAVIFASGAPL
jgi:putative ABC transport system substrate-binding protein